MQHFRQDICRHAGCDHSAAMHCINCEKKIKSNIRFVKGTKNIDTSVDDQKVTIVYDSKKAKYADYVAAFKKIGYEIKKK